MAAWLSVTAEGLGYSRIQGQLGIRFVEVPFSGVWGPLALLSCVLDSSRRAEGSQSDL